MDTDRPGREIPKEYRQIVAALIDQGWRYDASGKGHPKLYPADRTQQAIAVPGTPGDRRSMLNFRAQVRRAGGQI
jgi:hypothetical protein